ncbi:MAG: 50S ribosomal protein L24 [Candidatus Omnitrophica bacterium]|nr:50S ribosomal protein L24 [Candidatus Omnitrophota bacterium]
MERIKKNDIVFVISGKDRGKKGKVLSLIRKEKKAIVEGINLVKRHMRRRSAELPGGIIEKEAPIRLCKLMLFCPHCERPTRVGFTLLKDGSKARYCKKCKEII